MSGQDSYMHVCLWDVFLSVHGLKGFEDPGIPFPRHALTFLTRQGKKGQGGRGEGRRALKGVCVCAGLHECVRHCESIFICVSVSVCVCRGVWASVRACTLMLWISEPARSSQSCWVWCLIWLNISLSLSLILSLLSLCQPKVIVFSLQSSVYKKDGALRARQIRTLANQFVCGRGKDKEVGWGSSVRWLGEKTEVCNSPLWKQCHTRYSFSPICYKLLGGFN